MTHDMAVGFKVKFYWYQIGHGDFLYSFFSEINSFIRKICLSLCVIKPSEYNSKNPAMIAKTKTGLGLSEFKQNTFLLSFQDSYS